MKLIALDFDGVICDSAPENAEVSWRACRKLWPDTFPNREITEADVAKFCGARPFLETGYQGPLMTWMIHSGYPQSQYSEEFAANTDRWIAECGYDRPQLKQSVSSERDLWLRTTPETWFDRNHFFPGAADLLNRMLAEAVDTRIIVLTTKEDRFVKALMQRWGVNFPEENVYGLERIRTKEETLAQLMAESGADEVRFIEDRVETLLRFAENPAMDPVKLYFAQWGYSTAAQKNVAATNPRIHVVEELAQLFQ